MMQSGSSNQLRGALFVANRNDVQERIGKYGSRLFTFLDYDGVPWNNNNAEHAIKGFARVRRFADGRFPRAQSESTWLSLRRR